MQEAREINSDLTLIIFSGFLMTLPFGQTQLEASTEKLHVCSPYRSALYHKVQGEGWRVDPVGANGSCLALNKIKDDS